MPNQFTPVTTTNQQAALNQINNNFRKLDAESVTKTFGGQNQDEKLLIGKTGDSTLGLSYKKDEQDKIVVGKLPDGTYGIIFYDNDGLPSIYMSITADGVPVLKVAKEGKDASSASGDDLIFSSAQDVLKVVKTGTVNIVPPAVWTSMTSTTVAIPHGLSIEPAVLAYVNNPVISGLGYTTPGLSVVPSNLYLNTSGNLIYSSMRVDSTNLYLEITNVTPFSGGWDGFTWSFKYYILQQSAL